MPGRPASDHAAVEAALDCVVTIDEHGLIREFNSMAERTFGYARSEVLGKPMIDRIVPPAHRAAHAEGFARYLATGEERIMGRRIEIQAMRKDGSLFPVELVVTPLGGGARPMFTAHIRDLSERIDAEQRLLAAQRRYRELMESLPVVIYEADFGADGAWRYVSPQIEQLLGFPAGEWLDDPNLWFRQIHGEDRELVLAQERALRAQPVGERVACEYRMLTRSGVTLWVRDDAVVVKDESSNDVQMRGVIVDITDRKDLEEKLSRHAFYDALTGLPNRALYMDRLDQALARAQRDGDGVVAVLFLDIDDFKIVNDTLGHAAGDSMLSEIGARLTQLLRPFDTPARFGGDEFTVLLERVHGMDEVLAIAARISQAVAQPVRLGGRDVAVTLSVGVGMSGPLPVSAHELVSQADIAMYRAKENGGARAEIFDTQMSAEAWRRLDLQRDLRHAVERRELVIAYQPVVDLVTGGLVQVEALVRWRHPERGLLMPSDFIPFAESSGLISQIDGFVMHEACRQLAEWQKALPGARDLRVAVNVSPREFRHETLATDVAHVLSSTGLSASRLVLEITESASLAGAGVVPSVMERLAKMGVGVVVDDFGVGYTGLDYFKRFRLNGFKIDRSFTSGVARRREDLAIVTAALAFGKALGLSVVAEGIETEEQLRRLRALGCDHGQGFLISHPLSADEVGELLRDGRRLLDPMTRRTDRRGRVSPMALSTPAA
jgi:diguanylate cyclase (GGDEF)-like protein/PAS domain S-box-containing protein